MKFNRLKEDLEAALERQEFQLKYFTKSSEINIQHSDNHDNNNNNTNLYDSQYKYLSPELNQFNQDNLNVLRSRNRNTKITQRDHDFPTPETEKLPTRPRHNNHQTQSPKCVPKETSDKSTFTVNEISTQTDQLVQHQFFSVNNQVDKGFPKNGSGKNLMETDGKKLLLEAYLRNNDNMVHCRNSQTESSQASSCLLPTGMSNKSSEKRKSLR